LVNDWNGDLGDEVVDEVGPSEGKSSQIGYVNYMHAIHKHPTPSERAYIDENLVDHEADRSSYLIPLDS